MDNNNNLNDIEEDKNLYAFQLDDEYDPETDEDLPTKYELTEELIYGEKEAKQIVKDIYKDLQFVYGKFYPSYFDKWVKFVSWLIQIVILLGSGFMLFIAFYTEQYFCVALSIISLLAGLITHFYFQQEKREVWWYKWEGKTIVVQKILNKLGRGNIIVHMNKSYDWVFKVKQDQWTQNHRSLNVLDNRLMFNRFKGEIFLEKKNNEQLEIYTYDNKSPKSKSVFLILKNNTPKIIEYYPGYDVGKRKSIYNQKFEFLEINTDRYVEIPKSFIDFCKEQGIEPPEECEHLHYV